MGTEETERRTRIAQTGQFPTGSNAVPRLQSIEDEGQFPFPHANSPTEFPIQSVSNTPSIRLTVINHNLSADLVTLNISQFTNDTLYLTGVTTDGVTMTGDGTPGNPLVAVVAGGFVSSVADTNTVDLDVTLANLTANVRYQNTVTILISEDASGLKADFASMAISQFTNDVPYIAVESDPIFSTWLAGPPNVSEFTNDVPYITSATEFIQSVSGTATINLTVLAGNLTADFASMKVSQFTNDSGYTIPGDNVSLFTNDAGYTVPGDNVSLFTNDAGYITSAALVGYVPTARTLTINGSAQDLSANRTWAITVTGTSNRITVTGGTGLTPTIDIAATYVGQTSITTLGTITTGTWNAIKIGTLYGGTAVDSSTWTQGDIVYISGTGTWNHLAKDTNATRYLSNTGTTNNPAWAQVDLTNGVTGDLPFANLTQGSARSVLGVTGNATADFASIQGTADQVLVVNSAGTALAFGTVATAGITNNAVTYAKMQAVSTTSKLLGSSSTTTPVQEITIGTGLSLSGTTLSATSTGTVTSVSVVTANGVSGSVATATTTPAITLTLGAITPTTVNGLTLADPAGGNFTILGSTMGAVMTYLEEVTGWSITGNSPTVKAKFLKAFNVNNALTLEGTDSTTMTFPTTSATIARTDAAQTFTGIQTLSSVPVFSTGIGGATATTQTLNTNNTTVATTAYVDAKSIDVTATAGTTTNTTLTDITGLSASLVAGTYTFDAWVFGQAGTGTAGARFGINFTGTYTSGDYQIVGITTTGNVISAAERLTANNTANTTALWTTSATESWVHIAGQIVTGGSGTFTIRGLKVTSQTLTWRAGSRLSITRTS